MGVGTVAGIEVAVGLRVGTNGVRVDVGLIVGVGPTWSKVSTLGTSVVPLAVGVGTNTSVAGIEVAAGLRVGTSAVPVDVGVAVGMGPTSFEVGGAVGTSAVPLEVRVALGVDVVAVAPGVVAAGVDPPHAIANTVKTIITPERIQLFFITCFLRICFRRGWPPFSNSFRLPGAVSG